MRTCVNGRTGHCTLGTGARTHRIIEIEWAIKNDRPFAPSPKKPRRGPSRRAKSGSSKHRSALDADADEDADDAQDSGKENTNAHAEAYEDEDEDKGEGGSAKRRRRHVKSEGKEREPGTPPKRRRLVKFEDA